MSYGEIDFKSISRSLEPTSQPAYNSAGGSRAGSAEFPCFGNSAALSSGQNRKGKLCATPGFDTLGLRNPVGAASWVGSRRQEGGKRHWVQNVKTVCVEGLFFSGRWL